MSDKKDYNYLFKILIIGDSYVGKTNILKGFLHNQFDINTKETVGVEFGSKNFIMGEKDVVKAQIWDTAGQERYRAITKAYYKGAKGALLVYDISRKSSFDNIDNWLIDLRTNGDKDIIIVLIGNKSDLIDKREVNKEEANIKAEQFNIAFLETSTKSGENIDKAFTEIVEQIYKINITMPQNDAQIEGNNDNGISLVNKDEEKKKQKCC